MLHGFFKEKLKRPSFVSSACRYSEGSKHNVHRLWTKWKQTLAAAALV
jgi:hypothetical protein